MRFFEFVTEKTQSPAQWQKAMIKKYGEDGWYDIADAVRDYYESNAILDNTISDIIKIKNDHPSFTDYSGITKLYRYEKKDKSGAPTDDAFIPFAYNIKGAKNFVQSMMQGNIGFKKGDFELVEKDFNPGDAILNFTNLIELVHNAEDDDGEWYKREYEVWMKRTPYYAGTETNENFAENKINFTMPNFNFEWEEANRYEQYRKIGKEEWIKLAKTGKAVDVDNRIANDIENTEAGEEYRYDYWDGLVQAKRDRFAKALSSGQIELPIIARYSDGQLELISGNTRLTGMMRELGKAKAWIYDVPDEIADLEENFADGKKKGKSRPGRVKRSGASCNGSVTALRKRAKNASGEKAKMYHWCANMKSGRKKK